MKLLKRRLEEMGRGRLVGPDAERIAFEDLAQGLKDDYRINGRQSLRRAEDALDRLRGQSQQLRWRAAGPAPRPPRPDWRYWSRKQAM